MSSTEWATGMSSRLVRTSTSSIVRARVSRLATNMPTTSPTCCVPTLVYLYIMPLATTSCGMISTPRVPMVGSHTTTLPATPLLLWSTIRQATTRARVSISMPWGISRCSLSRTSPIADRCPTSSGRAVGGATFRYSASTTTRAASAVPTRPATTSLSDGTGTWSTP